MPFIRLKFAYSLAFFLAINCSVEAQSGTLTLEQQYKDFEVFKGGLREGHAGLYYFISLDQFEMQCDSIQNTLVEGASVQSFYLKLRYLITLLKHGHTRIQLPGERGTNFLMAVLDKRSRYLPLKITIIGNRIYVLHDCSKEQIIPKGVEITAINGLQTDALLAMMRALVPADGINTTFKDYNLYHYYYFHFLFELLYPAHKTFELTIGNDALKLVVDGRTPEEMETQHFSDTGNSLGKLDNPMRYESDFSTGAAYLKTGSFYKGFIEYFGVDFVSFIDSAFQDIKRRGVQNLILDLRDNEGGGDKYNDLLYTYLADRSFMGFDFDQVAGKQFNYVQYTVNLSDDVKAFIENPGFFLQNDSSLMLKPEFSDDKIPYSPAAAAYGGALYVLTNGGTFSAANILIKNLYQDKLRGSRNIQFIGEENGGDIYSNVLCAGTGYSIQLPNSAIVVDMPILASGTLNKTYPVNRLPDVSIDPDIQDLLRGTDTVLEYVKSRLLKN